MTNESTVKSMSLKKKALIVLCALVSVVVIVATSVLATIAYLTAADSITNTFTVGDVSLVLSETIVDTNGKVVEGTGAGRGDGNTYNLVPGTTYVKDPTIFIAEGSQKSYLFVTVRNDIANIEEEGVGTIAAQLKANGWAHIQSTNAGEVYVYIGSDKIEDMDANGAVDMDYAGAPEVAPDPDGYVLFETFTVDSAIESADLVDHKLSKIIINAFAIQGSGMTTVGGAWEAIVHKYSGQGSGKIDLTVRTAEANH